MIVPKSPIRSARVTKSGHGLAAVLIVRNEARCIARCLDSVRPWVDHIVVLDTGSSDDSVALSRSLGAEVHTLAWPDDFSAARNHALALADADWNLVIDADEWIMSGGALLRAWCGQAPRLGRVCVHSSSDLQAAGIPGAPLPSSRSWLTRLLPRGVAYEGRIHEQPISSLPRAPIDVHLGHDGYLGAQLRSKHGRNRSLLERELRERPDDPYILYQLGKEAEGAEDFGRATSLYGTSARRSAADANWLHELTIRYLYCLGRAGRLDDALALAGDGMDRWVDSPDFFFVLGNLLLDRAVSDPRDAVAHWLPLACAAWQRCLEIGERPDLEGSVSGRGSHLAQHNLDVVRIQMASLAA